MLNIVGIPKEFLTENIFARMLQGGVDKAREAGVEIIGGHTIDDKEPRFGFAVVGLVHPKRIYRNVGAKLGDVLDRTRRHSGYKGGMKKGVTYEDAMGSDSIR